MKLKLLKITAILLLLAGGFYSCEKENEEYTSIIGKWKLVKIFFPMMGKTDDYSQHNVVYEFNENGILTISVQADHIDIYSAHEMGKHTYSIIEYENYIMLKIDNTMYGYDISSTNMIIGNASLDGEIYYFAYNQ